MGVSIKNATDSHFIIIQTKHLKVNTLFRIRFIFKWITSI